MLRSRVIAVCLFPLLATVAPALAQAPAPGGDRLTALKQEAAAKVEGRAKLAQEMVDSVFSFGELGFQEVETSRYLTGDPREATASRSSAASPAFRPHGSPRWGSGKPVIALGSDIDGIPQASQKPGVAYHDPIVAGAPGHGEGHNSGVPLNIVAALAVKEIMEREKLPGTLHALAGRGRGAGGGQGVVRARRAVQGRGRHPVHPRRQQPGGVVGRGRRQRTGVHRVHLRGRDRAQRRRARGAAGRRSTRSS